MSPLLFVNRSMLTANSVMHLAQIVRELTTNMFTEQEFLYETLQHISVMFLS